MDAQGNFQSGKVGRKNIDLYKKGKRPIASSRSSKLGPFRKEYREALAGESPVIAEVMEMRNSGLFHGEDYSFNHRLCWVLVHYLFHGDAGEHAPAFMQYLELIGQGMDEADSLYKELGLSPHELDLAVAGHLAKLKAR